MTGLGLPLSLVATSFMMERDVKHHGMPAAMAANFGTQDRSSTEPGSETGSGEAISVQREADGLFYIGGRVNGRTTRFVVDTGASVVVLTERDALASGIDIRPSQFSRSMATVGGNSRAAWVRIKELKIAGYRMRDLDVAVVKGGGASLLGQNALRQLGGVAQDGDTITLR